MGASKSKNDFSNQVGLARTPRCARLLHASARTARADVLALPVANRPPPPPQIGTGSMGPPGSEELEIDIDMSTLDLRLKRLTNLPWDLSVRSAQLQRRKPHRPPTRAPLCLHAG